MISSLFHLPNKPHATTTETQKIACSEIVMELGMEYGLWLSNTYWNYDLPGTVDNALGL